MPNRTLFQKLQSHLDSSAGPDACWEWTGTVTAGYGKVAGGYKRPTVYAHRIAWVQANGAIPEGMVVCHSCDNPLCCNPAHLFLGTPLDNMRDRDAKGRGFSKITADDVEEIRSRFNAGESQHSLAKKFGVSQSHVSRVVRGIRRLPTNGVR